MLINVENKREKIINGAEKTREISKGGNPFVIALKYAYFQVV
jgi:hypothetical protein